jgi:hypothetical protein
MIRIALCLALLGLPAPAQNPAEETLNYTINWPSGLSLGEATLRARQAGERWEVEFVLDAAIPGYVIQDRYRSILRPGLCCLELEKQFQHGNKKGRERTSFDAERGIAIRETLGGGGKSEISVPACPRDALGFLLHLRRELQQGRLPAAQQVFFGARYEVSLEYRGFQTVPVNEIPTQADRFSARVKGPASEHSVEIYFARDPARTPVLVRVPFPLGIFSMELVR